MAGGKPRRREAAKSTDPWQGRVGQAAGEPSTNPIDLYRHGIALRDRGQPAEALKALLAARHQPGAPLEATLEAARLAFQFGRRDDAFRWLNEAGRRQPQNHLVPRLAGFLLRQLGRYAEAVEAFRYAHTLKPNDIESLKGLALCLADLTRATEAEPYVLRLIELAPNQSLGHALLSYVYAETNRAASAVAAAQEALRLAPNDVSAMLQLARGLTQLDRGDEAIAVLTRAQRLAPDQPATTVRVAKAFKEVGDLDRARETLAAVLARHPRNVDALWELSLVQDFRPGDPLIRAMAASVQELTRPSDVRRLHFALGKAYDDVGDPKEAFRHLRQANEIDHKAFPYNEQAALAYLQEQINVFSADLLERLSGGGVQSCRPIFVVGMPRSGSTLVEQILASHPDVAGGGEILFLDAALRTVVKTDPLTGRPDMRRLTKSDLTQIGDRYLESMGSIANGKPRVTDKLLSNRSLLGLISLALPNAKIIHCERDPIDMCLSCYMSPFGASVGYASDLTALGNYYRQYHAMMAHWQRVLPPKSLLTIRYEDVTSDTEAQMRRILAFCGLAWDERCLRFHETRRPVNTMSAAQVRKPLYHSSVGRWRAYADHLRPLIAALGDLAPQ